MSSPSGTLRHIALSQTEEESNQTPDGGMEFIKGTDFEYGHPQLTGKAGFGAMFPTWFRTLTLALAAHALGDDSFCFVRCPGMQFDVFPAQ